MPNDAAGTADLVRVARDEDFWDLVCADEDWLRAEFDAIIASGFRDRPGRPVLPRPAPRPRPGVLHASPRQPDTLGGWGPEPQVARQRSPPGW
ncbi:MULTISPECIES: hypothetical protein [unclassified Ornithinimicrobium]|uniref:hypothetical protein n=1 Tax=unclassified Ornithinimicrobium TaxID=2615080 RepID=UPI003853E110